MPNKSSTNHWKIVCGTTRLKKCGGCFVLAIVLYVLHTSWSVASVSEIPFKFRPRIETKYSVPGRILLVNSSQLQQIGFPITSFSQPTLNSLKNAVFVTAASGGYAHAALDAIARIQQYLPDSIIYYYDINEKPNPQQADTIRQLCNVVYRTLNFDIYPSHVRRGHTYAYKAAVIHEVLREHSSVFWIDSSIRLTTGNLTHVYKQAMDNGGFLTFDNSGHNIFVATHPTTFKYLPLSYNVAIESAMRGAGAILIHRSQVIYENIIKWWLLCSLVNECIAPINDLYCRFQGRDKYANCHRFDQSVINILAVNHYVNSDTKFYSGYTILTVDRVSRDKENLLMCNATGAVLNTISSGEVF